MNNVAIPPGQVACSAETLQREVERRMKMAHDPNEADYTNGHPVPFIPPRVSVCIMSHRPELLPQALASVHAQTYRDFEIVVKFCDRYWSGKLNEIISAARGQYIVVLCDDDELAPTFLERHVIELEKAHADIAYSDVAVFGEYLGQPNMLPVQIQLPEFDGEVLRLHCVPFMTALMRRELWERLGGYDGHQLYLDWDWWIRCYQAGARAVHLRHEYLFRARSHTHNGSKTMSTDEALRMLRRKHSALAPAPDPVVGPALPPDYANSDVHSPMAGH